jgi:hypothetical protein
MTSTPRVRHDGLQERPHDGLRDGQLTRRSLLRALVAGAAVSVVPVTAFAAAKKTTKKAKKAAATGSTTTGSTATNAPTAPASPATAAAAKSAVPSTVQPVSGVASGEVVVGFTYSTTDARPRNPYIAVWVETPAGVPVRTLALQYQVGKGQRWLPDLRRWYQADQTRAAGAVDVATTKSSPTRIPGAQKLVWDGKDDLGTIVPGGDYVLYIEGAREHGPYSLITQPINTTKPSSAKLADSGELTSVTVEVRG